MPQSAVVSPDNTASGPSPSLGATVHTAFSGHALYTGSVSSQSASDLAICLPPDQCCPCRTHSLPDILILAAEFYGSLRRCGGHGQWTLQKGVGSSGSTAPTASNEFLCMSQRKGRAARSPTTSKIWRLRRHVTQLKPSFCLNARNCLKYSFVELVDFCDQLQTEQISIEPVVLVNLYNASEGLEPR